jgi:hypothetical protein
MSVRYKLFDSYDSYLYLYLYRELVNALKGLELFLQRVNMCDLFESRRGIRALT